MDKKQAEMIEECIDAHRRMIMYHRRSIIELSRKTLIVPEICNECIDFEIINESGRSGKV